MVFIVGGLSATTIEYSCPSMCLSVCKCMYLSVSAHGISKIMGQST